MSPEQTPSRSFGRRSLLRASGTVAAAGFLAACGGNTGRGGSTGGKAISQWYHQYGEAGTQQAALRYAKAYGKADVSVQWIPGDYASKLSSGLVSSSGPDVFEFHPDVQMAKSGQIVPLDDIIADVKSDFTESDLAANSVDGKVYGIRMIDDPQFLYYRKSLLEKAGVQPPTTFDELIEASRKLDKDGVKGLYLGLKAGSDILASPLVWATGSELLTADHKVAFDNPATVEGLKKMRELYTSKTLLLGAPTDWFDPSAFIQGLTAMQWCGLWAMPGIQKALGDDFGIVPLPGIGSAGRPVVYNGGWSTYVSAKAKDVDAAKAFVKWLWIEQTKLQEDWCTSYGFHIPPRKSLAAKATKLQSGTAAEAVKLFGTNGHYDDPYWTQAMATISQDMVNNAVVSGKNPESEVAKARTRVEAELKKIA
ncbi:ABC transporter substrate-binding protein [Streptomyces turgidiscabies]|uniref:Multiple sugar transport system substrate-binding protein n=1 Tax=Streptomyces turgidiscabies TaxID=85558 RepID=A0ABU0RI19_9ACTN|nr:sugar ABC transporter substrate-binding protein [Streptomyces turgidiscabies]MDQ0931383.1 multiple sugar transport system substrate-binding protein [Streptomyces turgidiscabies]